MAQLPKEQIQSLRKAIADHDFLHRLLRNVEKFLRIVFHGEKVEWSLVRAAAEEILIADIVTRHAGQIDGVYFALRKREESGHSWDQALADYAAYCHNYFTTPLGIVIRRDYFGDDAHFISPSAGKNSALSQSGNSVAAGQRSDQPPAPGAGGVAGARPAPEPRIAGQAAGPSR